MSVSTLPPRSESRAQRRALARGAQALAVLALGGFGAVSLAGWVRERGDVESARAAAAPDIPEGAASGIPPDLRPSAVFPWANLYLDERLGFGPPARVGFGASEAWLAVASGVEEAPDAVFTRALARLKMPIPKLGEVRSIATTLLRGSASIGVLNGCAFLVALTPTVGPTVATIRTEPGAILLAMRTCEHWDYVAFLFPAGAVLDAPGDPVTEADDRLRGVSSRLGTRLEAVHSMRLGASIGPGGSSMLACRPRDGRTTTLDDLSDDLVADGWERTPIDVPQVPGRVGAGVVVARRGRSTAWLFGTDATDGSVLMLVDES